MSVLICCTFQVASLYTEHTRGFTVQRAGNNKRLTNPTIVRRNLT
jgi:hypothetical protein